MAISFLIERQQMMQCCPHCGHVENRVTAELERTGGNAPEVDLRRAASVALFHHVAEAGYFADRLQEAGIETSIVEHEEFEAELDRWRRRYVLRVPGEQAAAATALLEAELEATGGQATHMVASRGRSGEAWVAVCLLVVAGALALSWGPVRQAVRAAPREDDADALWRAVAEIDRTFSTPREPAGRPRHSLRFDARHERVVLESDWNGDGRADAWQAFGARRPTE